MTKISAAQVDNLGTATVVGAVGDGVADDTAAFQTAAAAYPNSRIRIPGGKSYKLSAIVTAYWDEEPGVTFTNLRPPIKKRGFYSDFAGGVNIARVRDRLLVGEACNYDGSRGSGVFGWLGNIAGGIYAYLATCANIYSTNDGPKGGVAITGAARDGGVSTLASPTAAIAVAAMAWQDTPGSTGGVWGLYSTVVREAGAGNSTLGLEIDIANKGTTATISPGAMFTSGLTAGLWLCSGGEITTSIGGAGLAKTASAAMGIVSNDPAGVANFDKGIVFHAKSLVGADGTTGEGSAIAFAKGHRLDWFNSASQLIGSITSVGTDVTKSQRIQFTDNGLIVTQQTTGAIQMQVPVIPNAVNYIQIYGAVAGTPPTVKATGTDANIDLFLAPTGTGLVRTTYGVGTAATPAAFSATNWLQFKDGNGNIIYLAGRLTPW